MSEKNEFAIDPLAPVGVFDSGLGGLTVVSQLQRLAPMERIVYFADQAHVPYGGRDLGEVQRFATHISAALLAYGCKAIVMACNISTATSLSYVQRLYPGVPIIGVIAPGAAAAVERSRNRRIGVLATEGTVRTGAYTSAIHAVDPHVTVVEVACPRFVPLIEAGRVDDAFATEAANEYLQPLREAGVDTVVLGCTHYPLLLRTLRSVSYGDIFGENFVDPAEYTVADLSEELSRSGLLATRPSGNNVLFTSGDPKQFQDQSARILPVQICNPRIEPAFWDGSSVVLPEHATMSTASNS